MTQNNTLYRRAACRYDRIIANFLAVHCWRNGFDGVRISDEEFCRMFEVKTLKRARKEWFLSDVSEWFPDVRHAFNGYSAKGTDTVILRTVHQSADDDPYDPDQLPIATCDSKLIAEYDENKIIMSLQEFALGLVGPQPKLKPSKSSQKPRHLPSIRRLKP